MIAAPLFWASLFWASLALVAYAYAGYPALLAALSAARGRAPAGAAPLPRLSVVIAAHNEGTRIAARVRDVLAQDYPPALLRVIVVDDGSSDDTAQAACAVAAADARVYVVQLAANGGKAAALNRGAAEIDRAWQDRDERHIAQSTSPDDDAPRHDIIAFADARQRYAPGALRALVAAFGDTRVGAVSGALVIAATHRAANGAPEAAADIASPNATSDGVGLYWRIERRLRADEARLGWLHGVSGANHALRRALFVPIPVGTILDDMWLPLQVCLRGARVWHADDAIAIDAPSAASAEEFRRKLRTLSGNWQLIARIPALLLPWRNPVWFAWWSHKLLRLLAPWALLLALLSSALAPGTFYRFALLAQLAAYAAALAALCWPRPARCVPLLPAAAAFVMLNAAALLALPAALAFAPSRLWKKH